jgi:hypothetical protein
VLPAIERSFRLAMFIAPTIKHLVAKKDAKKPDIAGLRFKLWTGWIIDICVD